MVSTPGADEARVVVARGTAVYVAGITSGSLDGPNAGVNNDDVFVRKYDEDGDLIWGRQFGTQAGEIVYGLAVDAAGNVYVGGFTAGSLAGNRGGLDAYLRKYNANGVEVWTRQFGTTAQDVLTSIAVDGSGNIYVAGHTAGSLFGQNKGGDDAFLRKYSPVGTVLWTRQIGTTSNDQAWCVATDSLGNVFIAGRTGGSLAAGSLGFDDIFLIKLNTNGVIVWQRQFGTASGDNVSANCLVVDSTGAAIVVGQTPGSLPGFFNAGGEDGFIRKYSSAGGVLKTDQFGTGTVDFVGAVARDATNNFYLVGTTFGSLAAMNKGQQDAYVRKYNSAGNAIWTRQFGTSSNDTGLGIAAPTSAKIYVVGATGGALGVPSAASKDAYVRRLNVNGVAVWTDQ